MNDGKPDDLAAKAEKLATEAVEAGKKFVASDTGKKVAAATDTAFQTAGEMGQKLADSEIGKQASAAASEAASAGKAILKTEIGKAMAIGAGAGALIAIPIPFVGPIFGAALGAAAGYLRVITKKS
jgi:hypothetical protein